MYINKATGKDSGYAFGTLWREITNGISSIGNTIVGSIHEKQVTERLEITEETERQKAGYEAIGKANNSNNSALTYVVVLLIFGVCLAVLFLKKKV